MEWCRIIIIPCIRICTMIQQYLHNIDLIILFRRTCCQMQQGLSEASPPVNIGIVLD